MTAGCAAAVGVVTWVFGETYAGAASLVFSVVMALLAAFVRRHGKNQRLVGHLICGSTALFLVVMATFFGDYQGLAPFAVPAVTALAFFLTGIRGALVWTLLPLLCFTGMVLGGDAMPASLHQYPVDDLLVHATVVCTSAGVLVVSWGFAKQEQRRNEDAIAALGLAELAQEEAELALQEAKAARLVAEAASQSKSAFLAAMSHEIRTPLNAVIGAAQLLKDAEGEEREMLLDTIQQSGVSLVGQIGDVLDFSRVEAGELQVVAVPSSAVALAKQVIAVFRTQAQDKELRLFLDVDGDVPARVALDPDRVRQVLLNLVGNALKFTRQGHVRLALSAANERLRVVVEDTGPGIPLQDRTRIFEPFRQVEEGLSRSHGGSGLGLAISRGLCQARGGDLQLEDSTSGSRFVMEVPAPVVQEVAHPETLAFQENLRVLLVEDNPVNRMIAGKMLERLGVEVLVAENGEVAVEMLLAHPVDLVLMDLQMPVMDGLQATRAIRLIPRFQGLPIVVLTANAFAEDRSAAMDNGASGFLSKPVQQQDLVAALRRHLPLTETKVTS
jgi:signal transduction histidine kinase/CheY-like chemotaxis protein